MPTLSYLTTTHFDFGAVNRLAKELTARGIKRPLFVTDKGVRAVGLLDRVLEAAGPDAPIDNIFDETPGNPTEAATLKALAQYEAAGCDGVVAIGGGSPMDLGKGVALLAGSGGPLSKFDPAAGGGRNITKVAPLIAIPTTAGTGSEVSIGAVIILEDGRKVGFGGNKLIPVVALCDPELTLGLPPLLTAATGMDAITHCIEAVLSPVVNPPAEGVGYDGLWRGWRALRTAVADGSNREARWQMMMASTEGAMAFVKGLGAVHAMSHSAGRLPGKHLHHGTLNAVTLPAVLRFNHGATEEKYERLRMMMGLAPSADLAEAIEEMNADIGLP
ncbi:MAG: iron-containing alcohol dehydrogenase, partial [Caulobacteraceae bacterium]